MDIFNISSPYAYTVKGLEYLSKNTPLEGIAFLIASFAVHFFCRRLKTPFKLIGISIIMTKHILNAIQYFDEDTFIKYKKNVYTYYKDIYYLKIPLCILAVLISLFFFKLGYLLSIAIGSFTYLALDIDNHSFYHLNKPPITGPL